jgi:hypothetical protein
MSLFTQFAGMRRINNAGTRPRLGGPVPVGIGDMDVKEFSLAGNEYN